MTTTQKLNVSELFSQIARPHQPTNLDHIHLSALPAEPFVLVQRSNINASTHVTIHESPEAAGKYHVDFEHPGDWEVIELVDVRNGDQFEVECVAKVTKLETKWSG